MKQCTPKKVYASAWTIEIHLIQIHYYRGSNSVHLVLPSTLSSCRVYSHISVQSPVESVVYPQESYIIPEFTQVCTAARDTIKWTLLVYMWVAYTTVLIPYSNLTASLPILSVRYSTAVGLSAFAHLRVYHHHTQLELPGGEKRSSFTWHWGKWKVMPLGRLGHSSKEGLMARAPLH